MENILKTDYRPDEIVQTSIGTIKIIKPIGKGKSGYSYLGIMDNSEVVLKVMHNEPVPYYSFVKNKVLQESNAYELLRALGISIPEMYPVNQNNNYLVKEYIPGITGSDWIIEDHKDEKIIEQLFSISRKVEHNKYNIDYFPSNFVINLDKLFYIDYEVNTYDEQWNLKNWGIYYWANEEGFRAFRKSGDAAFINVDLAKGLPIKEPFEDIVSKWIEKYSK